MRFTRTRRAAVVAAAVLCGMCLAAVAAQATTFPGTNGRIAASGPLTPYPPSPYDEFASQLELFTQDTGTGAECQLTHNTNSDYNPRFSKDGKKVAYIKDNNVWTLQLDDTGKCAVAGSEKQLTGLPVNPVLALVGGDDSYVGGWCTEPGGQEWVVFQRSAPPNGFEIYKQKINSDRTAIGSPAVMFSTTSSESQPAVTPDCGKVAFHSNRAGPTESSLPANSDVWVGNFDGTTGLVDRTDCSQVEESAPSWSPVLPKEARAPTTGSRSRPTVTR